MSNISPGLERDHLAELQSSVLQLQVLIGSQNKRIENIEKRNKEYESVMEEMVEAIEELRKSLTSVDVLYAGRVEQLDTQCDSLAKLYGTARFAIKLLEARVEKVDR